MLGVRLKAIKSSLGPNQAKRQLKFFRVLLASIARRRGLWYKYCLGFLYQHVTTFEPVVQAFKLEGFKMTDLDVIIRNGRVVDGSGGASRICDVALKDGLIHSVGENLPGTATKEIDATGMIVTPGFVDVHTHYDGQATWDSHLNPSSNLGTTTVVMGNCGVGFAPCKAEDHQVLMQLMEGVEEIPETAMAEGLPWTWETFPEYLDMLDSKPRDIDIAALVPHGPVRV
jgi:N-acyl-D-amino-acid deacylase